MAICVAIRIDCGAILTIKTLLSTTGAIFKGWKWQYEINMYVRRHMPNILFSEREHIFSFLITNIKKKSLPNPPLAPHPLPSTLAIPSPFPSIRILNCVHAAKVFACLSFVCRWWDCYVFWYALIFLWLSISIWVHMYCMTACFKLSSYILL